MPPEYQNEENYYNKCIDIDKDKDWVKGIVGGKSFYESTTGVNKIDY